MDDRTTARPNPKTLVATLRLHAEFLAAGDQEPRDLDGELLATANRSLASLEAGLRSSVTEHLGPEFSAELEIRRSSVELLGFIVLVGKVAITYGALRTGLDYVRQDTVTLFRRLVAWPTRKPKEPEIAAYLELGHAASKFTEDQELDSARYPLYPSRRTQAVFFLGMPWLVVMALLTTLLVVVFVKVL